MKRNATLKIIMLLMAGIIIGWIIAPSGKQHDQPTISSLKVKGSIEKMNMDKQSLPTEMIEFSPEAIAISNIACSQVTKGKVQQQIQLYGTVRVDECRIQTQPAHFGGRIDQLYINYSGEYVSPGDVIATLYSPELITAQQELLEAYSMRNEHPQLYQNARTKLLEYKLTSVQLEKIIQSRTIQQEVQLHATTHGVVLSKEVTQGMYIRQGAPMFTVADLSKVWIEFPVFQDQLRFIALRDTLTFTTDAFPGQYFQGRVIFISPLMDEINRTINVRIECNNLNRLLKPQMYVLGTIYATLDPSESRLLIPQSAVLWTGTRSIVYVRENDSPARFVLRQVILGAQLDTTFEVLSGLKEGEIIATEGVFCIDAEAQLEGKPNMLNPNGNSPAQHRMNGMKM